MVGRSFIVPAETHGRDRRAEKSETERKKENSEPGDPFRAADPPDRQQPDAEKRKNDGLPNPRHHALVCSAGRALLNAVNEISARIRFQKFDQLSRGSESVDQPRLDFSLQLQAAMLDLEPRNDQHPENEVRKNDCNNRDYLAKHIFLRTHAGYTPGGTRWLTVALSS